MRSQEMWRKPFPAGVHSCQCKDRDHTYQGFITLTAPMCPCAVGVTINPSGLLIAEIFTVVFIRRRIIYYFALGVDL